MVPDEIAELLRKEEQKTEALLEGVKCRIVQDRLNQWLKKLKFWQT